MTIATAPPTQTTKRAPRTIDKWPCIVYRLTPKPALTILAVPPATGDYCLDRSHDDAFATYRCTRRWGHGGRHANLIHGFGGVVRAVWGPKHLPEVTS